MDNNQDEVNRLINELSIQKNKERKYILKIEIAKVTDRSVKRALQAILNDIERKERRNRICVMALLVVIALIGLYILGVQGENKENEPKEVSASSNNQVAKSTSTEEVTQEAIKEKNLTEGEVKKWVSAVLNKRYQNFSDNYGYELEVGVDEKDQLVYIRVTPPKGVEIDALGAFRVSEKGELEEAGRYVVGANLDEWVVISKRYLDVSQVVSYPSPVSKSSDEATDKLEKLTAKEFAELYAKWNNNGYPIMHISEYNEKYGHITEYDDSIWIIAYNDRNTETVQFSEQTPYRMASFFYTYDNSENKAYRNRNNGSGEIEFLPDLTNFINNNR